MLHAESRVARFLEINAVRRAPVNIDVIRLMNLLKQILQRTIDFIFRQRTIAGLLIKLGAAGTIGTPLYSIFVEAALEHCLGVSTPGWMPIAGFAFAVAMVIAGICLHIWEKKAEIASGTEVKTAIVGGESYFQCFLVSRTGHGKNDFQLLTIVYGESPLRNVKLKLIIKSDIDEFMRESNWPHCLVDSPDADQRLREMESVKQRAQIYIDIGDMQRGQGPIYNLQLPVDTAVYVLEVVATALNGQFFTTFTLRGDPNGDWHQEPMKYGKLLDVDNLPRKASPGPVAARDLFVDPFANQNGG